MKPRRSSGSAGPITAAGPEEVSRERPDGRVGRHGYTLIEGAVACLLMSLVLPPVMSGLASARRSAEVMTRRAEANSTARGVFTVLGEELRRAGGLGPHADLVGPVGLELRAFRGTGIPCGPALVAASGVAIVVPVSYAGTRLPDETKDSVEAVLADGSIWRTAVLGATRSPECDGGMTLTLDGVVAAGPVLLRLYERGEYSLSDKALRYRRGGSGRQPLTPERIASGTLGEPPGLPGLLRVRVELSPDLPSHGAREVPFVLGGGA